MVTGSTRFRPEFDFLITCLNCSPITEGSISILKLMAIWMWISITPSRMSGSSWDRRSIRRSATRKAFCEPDTFSCPWMRRWAWRRSISVAVLPSQWIPRYVFGSSAICKPNLCTTSSKALRGELAPTCTLAFCTDGRITTRSNHCSRRLLAQCGPRAGEIRAWPSSFPVRKACYDDRNRRLRRGKSDLGKKALDSLGQDAVITSDAEVVSRADKLIVPGVGHFAATSALNCTGLRESIQRAIQCETPFLG